MRRTCGKIWRGVRTQDGAGVSLVRVLGNHSAQTTEPFLMLDSFDSRDYNDYKAGFPFHPHRGIETISYIAEGAMTHRDSLGHKDTIESGEVQWMVAGSGILHEEFSPERERLLGVQLWLNLPEKDKMCDPSYTAIHAQEIPMVALDDHGSNLRVLAGRFGDTEGYQSKHLKMNYYELNLQPHTEVTIEVDSSWQALAFTLEGPALIAQQLIGEKSCVQLVNGDSFVVSADDEPARVLVMMAEPLHEPIAWAGPIVMNTREELIEAFDELDKGTFVKHKLN